MSRRVLAVMTLAVVAALGTARMEAQQSRPWIEVPVTLVDALLGGRSDRLDLKAALAELTDERGDIVTVRDGEKRVRVWIDESKS